MLFFQPIHLTDITLQVEEVTQQLATLQQTRPLPLQQHAVDQDKDWSEQFILFLLKCCLLSAGVLHYTSI